MIGFGTYSIFNRRNGRIKYKSKGMDQDNLDLGLFQDIKVTDRIHTRMSAGYQVLADDATIQHHVGMNILYREMPHFQVKAFRLHGKNLPIFQLVSGSRIWFIVGCYLSLEDTLTTDHIVVNIDHRPRRAALLVTRKFNAELVAPKENLRREEIAAEIATANLKEMSANFIPRCKYCA